MKIVIVGCGNVGTALVEQLSGEGHNITVVDEKEELVQAITNTCLLYTSPSPRDRG